MRSALNGKFSPLKMEFKQINLKKDCRLMDNVKQ